MSKNGTNGSNNRISYGQYKAADIFMFLLIMCICEILNVLAASQWFSSSANFAISVMLLVSLVVMIRWGWLGMIFPIIDGILYSWIMGSEFHIYIIYAVGNAFVALTWFFLKFVGKERVVSNWYLTLIYAIIGYVLMVLGRSLVAIFYNYSFVSSLIQYIKVETLNLFFAAAGLLILRRFDGMLVDQKQYLLKVTKERDTIKPAESDYQWNGYTELNEDDLRNLAAMDDYDRQVASNRKSLNDFGDETSDEDDLSRLDE